MTPLFKLTEQQQLFETAGYVKVKLLSNIQVQQLLSAYAEVAPQHEAINIPYITTSHSNNAELIAKVDTELQAVLAPELDKILTNYKLLFGNFLIKMPLPNSQTDPHQDITFVDESKYASVNIWVALQDTTVKNGCMYFMPGSHKLMPTIRPTHNYKWAYEFVKEEIKERSNTIEVKAGEAVIFHHGVLHGSFTNNTGQPRVAAVIAAYSDQAPLIHYYLPNIDSNRLQKYSMTKDAYLSFVKQQPPAKGVYLNDEEFDFKQLSRDEFLELVGEKPSDKSWLGKLTGWWNKKEVTTNE